MIADYTPMVYFIFYLDIISDLEKLQGQYKRISLYSLLRFLKYFYYICSTIPFFSEPCRVSCRHGVPLLLNSLMCAS